ncbi:MAG: methyltransferase domain-containing protein [Acidobacteria bacterium]|nr:methyltransferase domain-containing protein [Acidobacteriota bacterium]
MPWNPDRYQLFKKERFQPFDDLFRLVKRREGMCVVDLGCGTGELTKRLADELPGSDVTGIDSSPEMLARADGFKRSGLRFELGSIEIVEGEWDLVFSHAALQWVDDHQSLVPRLLRLVQPHGQLAVQLPSNHKHASHTLITETAQEEPFRQALGGWTKQYAVLHIADYAALLYEHGGEEIIVFEKVYPHILESSDALADWTSSTALVPYFERLPEELHEPFMQRYRARLRAQWPNGPVFYGFKRIIFAATRP